MEINELIEAIASDEERCSMKELTQATLDAILTPPPRKIWGATAIARYLGCSVDKVYALARQPAAPIYRPSGAGYFAFRSELDAWLKTKPDAPI